MVSLHDAVAEAAAPYREPTASHPEALSALLNFADGERAEALQHALGLSQPGVAHLTAKLEDRGLVRRRSDPADRRASLVFLTASGRRLAKRMLADRQAAIARVLAPLSPAEQASLLGMLDRMLCDGTQSVLDARRICRLCATDACDHPATCPVTAGADRHRSSAG